MTNQQLTLLIRSFRTRLSTEISRLRDALPEGSEFAALIDDDWGASAAAPEAPAPRASDAS